MLVEHLQVVDVAADCARPSGLRGKHAVNASVAEPLSVRYQRWCAPPKDHFNKPEAVRWPPPATEHAACIERQCRVMPGGGLTRDEMAEEARGDHTRAAGQPGCYQDSDCSLDVATMFPAGAVDRRGRELCPVCERPGQPLVDEAARVARLQQNRTVSALLVDETAATEGTGQQIATCPSLQCLPRLAVCEQRTCRTQAPARATAPVPASRFAIPPEPPAAAEPPQPIQIERTPELRCSADRDCVVKFGSCGAAITTRRDDRRQLDKFCKPPLDPPPPPIPTCFDSVCTSTEIRDEVLQVRRQRNALLPAWNKFASAHRAWERQVAKIKADLQRTAEHEVQ